MLIVAPWTTIALESELFYHSIRFRKVNELLNERKEPFPLHLNETVRGNAKTHFKNSKQFSSPLIGGDDMPKTFSVLSQLNDLLK